MDVYNSLASGARNDGLYEIWPGGVEKPFKVQCTFDSEGLWTEIQRREDGGTNFQVGQSKLRPSGKRLGSDIFVFVDLSRNALLQLFPFCNIQVYSWKYQVVKVSPGGSCEGARTLVCLRSFWEYFFLCLRMTLCKGMKALVCPRTF